MTPRLAAVRQSGLEVERGSDRILPITRVISAAVTLVLGATSLTLLLWPAETAERFAWSISPPLTPLVMGAGYASGAALFAATVIGRRWHEVAVAIPAISLFVWMTAIATLLHVDRFNHGHPWFFVWASLYGITPILLPILWFLNRRADPGPLVGDRRRLNRPLQAVLVAGGGAELGLAALLFVAPELAASFWPWALTPLTARVVGSWFAVAGGAAAMAGLDGRWTAARLALVVGAIFAALVLVGVARAPGDLDPANPLAAAYVALVAASLAVFAGLLWWFERGPGAGRGT